MIRKEVDEKRGFYRNGDSIWLLIFMFAVGTVGSDIAVKRKK